MGDFLNKIKQMWNTPDDEYDYDDKDRLEYDEETDTYRSADSDYYSDDSVSDNYSPDPFSSSYDDTPVYTPPAYTPPVYTPPAYTPPVYTPPAEQKKTEPEPEQSGTLQVVVYSPDRFSDETRKIADELVSCHTVVLNLENANKDNSRRIIDFLSGAAYATGGRIKRAAAGTFVIIPKSVNMTGDELIAQLESSGVIS